MADISNYLNQIKTAIKGEDVRGAIHDAIETCYTDGNWNATTGMVDVMARRKIDQFLNQGTGQANEHQLWPEEGNDSTIYCAMSFSLTADPSQYDMIRVYYKVVSSGNPQIFEFPASEFASGPSVIAGLYFEEEANPCAISGRRINIRHVPGSTDPTVYEAYNVSRWNWTGVASSTNNANDAWSGAVDGTSAEGYPAGQITKITGIKFTTVEEAASNIIGDKDELTTTDKTDLVAAINEVNSKTSELEDAIDNNASSGTLDTEPMVVNTTVNGWRLNESDGYCHSESAYKFVKYLVTPGVSIKVVSDDRFQFQNAASVPTGGTSARVGDQTYGHGEFYLDVPTGATYLILSTPINNSEAAAYLVTDFKDEVVSNMLTPIFYNGTINNHLPDYSNASNCRQWLVTNDILHVKKNSYIKCTGTTMYLIVESYNESGTWVERLYAGNLSTTYSFKEDAYIRIAARATDYTFLIPSTVSSNYKFHLANVGDPKEKEVKVTFIGLGAGMDYNSGQAQLVRLPNGKNLLIDSHLMASYTSFYYKLRDRGVRHIDYYVQSHYHGDHTGLLNLMTQQTMANNIDITGMIAYLPPVISESSLSHITGDTPSSLVERQTEFTNIFNQNGCTIIRPTEGQIVDLGDGIKLEFYNTDHSDYSNSASTYYSHNYNDWSLCCYLHYGDNSINFAADIGPIGQRKVGGTLKKASILTAPHHGWDNGANNLIPAFINNVDPDVVISTNGREHHPDNASSPANILLATSAMQTFCEANGVSNYMTCLNGPIDIVMDKYNWRFNGRYSRYIRNGKNWKFSDNTDKQE